MKCELRVLTGFNSLHRSRTDADGALGEGRAGESS